MASNLFAFILWCSSLYVTSHVRHSSYLLLYTHDSLPPVKHTWHSYLQVLNMTQILYFLIYSTQFAQLPPSEKIWHCYLLKNTLCIATSCYTHVHSYLPLQTCGTANLCHKHLVQLTSAIYKWHSNLLLHSLSTTTSCYTHMAQLHPAVHTWHSYIQLCKLNTASPATQLLTQLPYAIHTWHSCLLLSTHGTSFLHFQLYTLGIATFCFIHTHGTATSYFIHIWYS